MFSLPTPLSPVTKTEIFVEATLKAFSIPLSKFLFTPIIPNLLLTDKTSMNQLIFLIPLPISVALVQFKISTSTISPILKFSFGKTTTVF